MKITDNKTDINRFLLAFQFRGEFLSTRGGMAENICELLIKTDHFVRCLWYNRSLTFIIPALYICFCTVVGQEVLKVDFDTQIILSLYKVLR